MIGVKQRTSRRKDPARLKAQRNRPFLHVSAKTIRLIKMYFRNQNYFDIASIDLESSFLLLDEVRIFFRWELSARFHKASVYRHD